MKKRSKKYNEIRKNFSSFKKMEIKEAVSLIKKNASAKFDESVDLNIFLSIDPKKTEQALKGEVVLPSGSPKEKRIAVFTADAKKAKEALKNGAKIAGGEELIEKIKKTNKIDFDITVAEPAMMPKISQIAKILGPKGLMPSPKTGTVSTDPIKVLSELKGGKINFRSNEEAGLNVSVAKISWDEEKIVKNIEALIQAIRKAKPEAVKKEIIKKAYIASTMGPSIKLKV